MRRSTEFAGLWWRRAAGAPDIHRIARRQSFGRIDAPELMDGVGYSDRELATNFRDIRRVNRWFGGVSAVLGALPAMIPAGAQRVSLLDLATGVADIPLAIEQWGRARGIEFEITATDHSSQVLALAQEATGSRSAIRLLRADARHLPFPDRSFDIVTCSLALHHFGPDDAVQILREMRRLGRAGFIVNDLRRSRVAFGATWLASRLTTRNRLTRHDAPVSIRRAYTPGELGALLEAAGVHGARIERRPWFRMVAIGRSQP